MIRDSVGSVIGGGRLSVKLVMVSGVNDAGRYRSMTGTLERNVGLWAQ